MRGNRWATVDPSLFVEKDDGTCDMPKMIDGKGTTDNDTRTPVSAPHVESSPGDESLGTEKITRLAVPCRIHLHSIRRRLADSDGICGKYVIDGIIHAGILPDDSPEEVKETSFSQEKSNQERTIIKIYSLKELQQ